jgi:hypothetical protein
VIVTGPAGATPDRRGMPASPVSRRTVPRHQVGSCVARPTPGPGPEDHRAALDTIPSTDQTHIRRGDETAGSTCWITSFRPYNPALGALGGHLAVEFLLAGGLAPRPGRPMPGRRGDVPGVDGLRWCRPHLPHRPRRGMLMSTDCGAIGGGRGGRAAGRRSAVRPGAREADGRLTMRCSGPAPRAADLWR